MMADFKFYLNFVMSQLTFPQQWISTLFAASEHPLKSCLFGRYLRIPVWGYTREFEANKSSKAPHEHFETWIFDDFKNYVS